MPGSTGRNQHDRTVQPAPRQAADPTRPAGRRRCDHRPARLGACSDTDPFAVDRASGGYSGGPIIIGSQQYYSNEIIAELYAQMMEKVGLSVTREYQIGQREVYLPELEAGKIHVIPEYGGNLLEYYSKTSASGSPTAAAGTAAPSRTASDTCLHPGHPADGPCRTR